MARKWPIFGLVMGVLVLDLMSLWMGSTQVPLEPFQMVHNGNDPTESGKHHFWAKWPKNAQNWVWKLEFDPGTEAFIGGEYFGTIRTIPDGF